MDCAPGDARPWARAARLVGGPGEVGRSGVPGAVSWGWESCLTWISVVVRAAIKSRRMSIAWKPFAGGACNVGLRACSTGDANIILQSFPASAKARIPACSRRWAHDWRAPSNSPGQ